MKKIHNHIHQKMLEESQYEIYAKVDDAISEHIAIQIWREINRVVTLIETQVYDQGADQYEKDIILYETEN